MTDEKVIAVVVTFNGINWIRQCLESLLAGGCSEDRIIVVDNGSSDGTLAVIKKHFPAVQTLSQSSNLGFGQANNLGIQKALEKGADYLFLLNQDAWLVSPQALAELVRVAHNHPNLGVLSPIHLNGGGDALDLPFAHYISPPHCMDFISDAALGRPLQEVYLSKKGNAAAWLIPVKTIIKIGGFDPIFFHYGEDDNFLQRLFFHGFELGIVPSAQIIHDRPQKFDRNHYLQDEFERYLRTIKIELADVNKSPHFKFQTENRNWIKSILFAILTLNIRATRKYLRFWGALRRMYPEILHSWTTNKIEGPHYLNSDGTERTP